MRLTEDEYRQHRSEDAGYCLTCDDVTSESHVEPDARNYRCPVCESFTLMGIEEALIEGRLDIE